MPASVCLRLSLSQVLYCRQVLPPFHPFSTVSLLYRYLHYHVCTYIFCLSIGLCLFGRVWRFEQVGVSAGEHLVNTGPAPAPPVPRTPRVRPNPCSAPLVIDKGNPLVSHYGSPLVSDGSPVATGDESPLTFDIAMPLADGCGSPLTTGCGSPLVASGGSPLTIDSAMPLVSRLESPLTVTYKSPLVSDGSPHIMSCGSLPSTVRCLSSRGVGSLPSVMSAFLFAGIRRGGRGGQLYEHHRE